MTEAYPLHWPDNWPRWKRPGSSQFRTTLNGAMNNVETSLRKFSDDSGKKLINVTISSNVTLGKMRPDDAGIAVYFTWDGISTCIAVDRYAKVEDNLQAIHHCIEAERTKLRHGGLNLVRAAFRGYAALPPPAAVDCWSILDIKETSNKDGISRAYKAKAKTAHPDNGGSDSDMATLNAARTEALRRIA